MVVVHPLLMQLEILVFLLFDHLIHLDVLLSRMKWTGSVDHTLAHVGVSGRVSTQDMRLLHQLLSQGQLLGREDVLVKDLVVLFILTHVCDTVFTFDRSDFLFLSSHGAHLHGLVGSRKLHLSWESRRLVNELLKSVSLVLEVTDVLSNDGPGSSVGCHKPLLLDVLVLWESLVEHLLLHPFSIPLDVVQLICQVVGENLILVQVLVELRRVDCLLRVHAKQLAEALIWLCSRTALSTHESELWKWCLKSILHVLLSTHPLDVVHHFLLVHDGRTGHEVGHLDHVARIDGAVFILFQGIEVEVVLLGHL